MSLLKRIGGSGPLESNGDRAQTTGNMPNGHNAQPGQSATLPRPPGQTGAMQRQTGRVGPPTEDARRQGGLSNQENMLDLKNRVQQKLIAELDPKLDLTKTDEVRRDV